MATFRGKWDKDTKEAKSTPRRNSLPEDVNWKDLLREIQSISNKQDLLQKEIHEIARKQDTQHKILQEDMADLKKEIKQEVNMIKTEVVKNIQEISGLKLQNDKMEKIQLKMQRKLETLEAKNSRIEKIQDKLEQNTTDFQLRLRNIQEEPKENIKQISAQIIAKILNCTEQDASEQIDTAHRIYTNYAKKNKVARDTIVHFVKKSTREEVFRGSKRQPTIYKESKIMVYKEFPQSTLNSRRKYLFLTDELKRLQIKFRWERQEGLMLTYKEERVWIKSEEKADEFYRKLKKDILQQTKQQPPSLEKNPRQAKKRRQDSPKEIQIALFNEDTEDNPEEDVEEEEEGALE
ncbi:uncharacterized protein LOC134299516 [Anolis carolinensis]|uniref:uncharacterized protein LOC134297123 n=1 Tax=Anolis carolinensis TaxID=28377 RepID=UPI002F2B7A47